MRRVGWIAVTMLASSCSLVLGIDGDYHQSATGGAPSSSTSGAPSTTSSSGPTGAVTSGNSSPTVSSSSTSTSVASSSSTGSGPGVDLVDDMEDDDNHILPLHGRKGFWFAFNDKTVGATQFPPQSTAPFVMSAPGADGSLHALHTLGMGFTNWGAGVQTDLDNDGSTRVTYDASAYKGIVFKAKAGSTARSGMVVRFRTNDVNVDPSGGICDDTNASTSCNDGFGVDLTLGPSWTQYSFAWADLTQEPWGLQVPSGVAKGALYGLLFQSAPNTTFDFWVDDIGFYQ